MPPGAAAFDPGKTHGHDFRENKKARHLGAGRDQSGGGGGRTFIRVGRPEMEGNGRDLEAKSNHGHDDGHGGDWIEALTRRSIRSDDDVNGFFSDAFGNAGKV